MCHARYSLLPSFSPSLIPLNDFQLRLQRAGRLQCLQNCQQVYRGGAYSIDRSDQVAQARGSRDHDELAFVGLNLDVGLLCDDGSWTVSPSLPLEARR